jgi:hypothetical protein
VIPGEEHARSRDRHAAAAPPRAAFELVEDGLITSDDFRDLMFANAVRLWGEVNPPFFEGTAVEREADAAPGTSSS